MIAVVLNPASGPVRREHLREDVAELFREAGLEASVRIVAEPNDIAAAAAQALDAHAEAIVAGGGDGTISAVAAAVAGTSTPLGVLPFGTLNHFAKDAGIPLDLHKAVEAIAARRIRRIDVGRVNDRIFLNNASIGVYPSFVEARDKLREQGRSKWVALTLATAHVLRREGEMRIRLEGNRTRIIARTPFVFVGNNEYLAEGFKMGGRTRLDEGRLHLYYAPPVRTRDLPRLFAHAVLGRARRDHALESLAGPELWIDTLARPRVDVACDGEVLTLQTPLHCRSWPSALSVFVPPA